MDRVAALFDVDKTLLDTSSGQLYARYLYRTGQLGLQHLARVAWWSLLGELGILKMEKVIPRLLDEAAGDDEAEFRRRADHWFAMDVVSHVTESGRRRLEGHQAQGHVVALVSASTQYVVAPLAAYLGIPGQFLCTMLESRDGRLTGEAIPPVCYGPGKVIWAERFAVKEGIDLDASYFYTDSVSDLPLLERVGHPVAVNPDPRLRRAARQRGWPIETFY
jgi:HAD superfamily hydrolase (TIGR01490 family)